MMMMMMKTRKMIDGKASNHVDYETINTKVDYIS